MGSNPHEFRLMLGTDKCCASCSRVPISKLWTLGLGPKYLLLGWLGLKNLVRKRNCFIYFFKFL